ncbi:hypothetical protein A2U01_0055719, partial [Trifolium medium]|nr:hypothetical protein [Trifolium medium]
KRKRSEKTSDDQEPKKKSVKKEAVESSEKKKEEKSGKEKVVEKKDVEKEKKDKKRKAPGIKIDEGRSKKKHDKKGEEDESSTESDDVPLTRKLKQKTSKDYAKEMHKTFSSGKFYKSSDFVHTEAQIPGMDIPLTTVLPE